MEKHASSLSDMRERVVAQLETSAALVKKLAKEETDKICLMADSIVESYRSGGKLLICGNGGSAADAQHLAGELVGRFLKERPPLSCIALTTDSSVLTAVGNDYGFENVFSRQVMAHGCEGDVLLAISTSGDSANILKAVEAAKKLKMRVLALSGRDGGKLAPAAGVCITVPSRACPRIQEAHITIGHIICDLVEQSLFPK
jgi:D-sedoheptulose 7-phosphate isomerase